MTGGWRPLKGRKPRVGTVVDAVPYRREETALFEVACPTDPATHPAPAA